MNILCLGDSIVFGFGVPRAKAWISSVEHQTDWTLINAGVPGDTTGGMLARLPLLLKSEKKPDLLFLFGGQNDLMAGCDACIPSANMMAMGQQALSIGIPVAFSVPTPIVDDLLSDRWKPIRGFRADDAAFFRYRDFLSTLADSFPSGSGALIDFYTPFFNAASKQTLFSDGIHLTSEGQSLFASVFIEGIKTHFKY